MIRRVSEQPQGRNGSGPRLPNGRFAPGHSGNPGGMPKGLAATVRAQMSEADLTNGMVRIAKGLKIAGQKPTIVEIMRAREWLADRGHGKAPAFAPIEGENPLELSDVDRAITAALDELAPRREAEAARRGAVEGLAEDGQASADTA